MPTPPDPPAARPLLPRLLSLRAGDLLARNTIVSCGAFVLDLALLRLLVEQAGMNKYPAAAIGFILATSLHYAIGRLWIFVGSRRGLAAGYVYFVVNAGIGLAVTIALFAFFTEIARLDYIVARIVASVFAGLAIFVLNAVLNFKSL